MNCPNELRLKTDPKILAPSVEPQGLYTFTGSIAWIGIWYEPGPLCLIPQHHLPGGNW